MLMAANAEAAAPTHSRIPRPGFMRARRDRILKVVSQIQAPRVRVADGTTRRAVVAVAHARAAPTNSKTCPGPRHEIVEHKRVGRERRVDGRAGTCSCRNDVS